MKLRSLKNYARSEDQTYLTLPERYIVYSADEYAAFLDGHRPSEFPFSLEAERVKIDHVYDY